MELIFPSIEHKEDALAFRQEHFDNGEVSIHGDGGLDHSESYEGWLDKLQASLTRDDGKFVPSATYFGMVGGRIIGSIDIRYRLNDYLMLFGGHIGYSIRPCEREKGYATQMLALALGKCREKKIYRVLITCNKGNVPSAKTIVKNGGIFENEVTEEDGTVVERYWIDTASE